jgi:UrcA family protein
MVLAALISSALLVGTTLAQDKPYPHSRYDQKSILVDFDDLNPTLPADARILLGRIAHGVSTACFRSDDTRYLFLAEDRAACRKAQYAAALNRINRAWSVDLEALAASAQAHQAERLATAASR